VLGLILLKFADTKFILAKREIEKHHPQAWNLNFLKGLSILLLIYAECRAFMTGSLRDQKRDYL